MCIKLAYCWAAAIVNVRIYAMYVLYNSVSGTTTQCIYNTHTRTQIPLWLVICIINYCLYTATARRTRAQTCLLAYVRQRATRCACWRQRRHNLSPVVRAPHLHFTSQLECTYKHTHASSHREIWKWILRTHKHTRMLCTRSLPQKHTIYPGGGAVWERTETRFYAVGHWVVHSICALV